MGASKPGDGEAIAVVDGHMARVERRSWLARVVGACVLLFTTAASAAVKQGDVYDQFFRFGDTDTKVYTQDLPGEAVDPFTGTLSIVQEEFRLPGRAGHDLRVNRIYSSKIWGRVDLFEVQGLPLLAEQERSTLGYGWSLHMGRLRDPFATGQSLGCGGTKLPVFQGPDGSSHVLYPLQLPDGQVLPNVFVSKDQWRLDIECGVPGSDTACLWSDAGMRWEFKKSGPNPYFDGSVLMWPVSAIVDLHGNRIAIEYENATGAVTKITDTYSRVVSFGYDGDGPNRRLVRIQVGDPVVRAFQYEYTPLLTEFGSRRFLTKVTPVGGPSYSYDYYPSVSRVAPPEGVDVGANCYALRSITYPSGGTTTYRYEPVPFFTGSDSVEFAVVSQKTTTVPRAVGGNGQSTGTWRYKYEVPGTACELTGNGFIDPSCAVSPNTGELTNFNVTTVTRPDGMVDSFMMIGLRYVMELMASDHKTAAYAIGLTVVEARANGQEVIGTNWGYRRRPGSEAAWPLSPLPYTAPVYTDGQCRVMDSRILVPIQLSRTVLRDEAYFTTEYLDFDEFGQPGRVEETARIGGTLDWLLAQRSSEWTYYSVPADHVLRGRPLTRRTCVDGDCVSQSWSYGAGPAHLLESETDSGVTTRFAYHADGNLWKVTNALGQTLRLEDYDYGPPTLLDYNRTITVTRQVDWQGRVKREVNGRGFASSYEYDALGRVILAMPPGANAPTVYDYTPDGRPDGEAVRQTRGTLVSTSILDGMGRAVWSSEWDVGRPEDEARLSTTRFDEMGRAWFKSYPWTASFGEVGTYVEYDGLGRDVYRLSGYRPELSGQAKSIVGQRACNDSAAPGASCSTWLTHQANCVTEVRERGSTGNPYGETLPTTWTVQCALSFGDPSEALPRQVDDGSGNTWTYAYNAAGKLRRVTAPLEVGNRTYEYDSRQFLTSQLTGESGQARLTYDAVGQVATSTDARGVIATYDRSDGLSRVTGRRYGGTGDDDVTMSWDEANNLKSLASGRGGAYEFDYDEVNRLIEQRWTYRSHTYVTRYHYDMQGCLDLVTYPTGAVVSATCDASSRPTSVQVFGAGAYELAGDIQYHATGQPTSYRLGNGIAVRLTFDDRGRATLLEHGDFIRQRYRYDGQDNVVEFEDERVAGSARWMRYDEVNRLKAVNSSGRWGEWWYEYDALGNRTRKALTTPAGDSSEEVYSYDAANRLESTSGGAPKRSLKLAWDRTGKLAKTEAAGGAGATTYVYDGQGRRVEKAEPGQTTVYHYDAAGRVMAETTPNGVKIRDYYYLGNKLLAADACGALGGSGCLEWYHTDTLGSVWARTNDAGILAQLDYQPFGEQWQVTGDAGDRQYNGRVYDPGTGFHDYGARLYWPEIGRFISADSVKGEPGSPMTLNRYTYVLSNPYKYVDPTGNLTIIIHGTFVPGAAWAQPSQSDFPATVAATFGEQPSGLWAFNWGGGNSREARTTAATYLSAFIEGHLQPGEKLNIVAHSHGGNVVKEYTNLPGARTIDNFFALGTPVRPDYVINRSKVKNFVNVYSEYDGVQVNGGPPSWGGTAGRRDKAATNVDASAAGGKLNGHGDMHSKPVWKEAAVHAK